MGLTVTVLGCSGTYAGPGNACSGYLVRGGGTTVWVDCGPGTLANLQRHVDLDALDGVVVSHSHPDHWLELPVLRNALKYGRGREGMPLHTTAETRGFLDHVAHGDCEPTFDWRQIADGDRVEIGALQLTFSRTDHPVETLAMRIEGEGASLAYSADTGPGWSLTALGPGIDVALCEATLLAHQEGTAPHLSGRQAGASARDAGARRLVITHIYPTSDPERHRAEAHEAFGAPVEVAAIHESFEVST